MKEDREILEKVRDFLLIVANDGANRVFLERNARALIIDLDFLLATAWPTKAVSRTP